MASKKLDLKRFAFPGIFIVVLAAMAAAVLLPREIATAQIDKKSVTADASLPLIKGASGFPVPRFVSLKAGRANVRIGPSTKHHVVWVYSRKGLPVEVVAEFEHWRRIRDSDGEEGWVYHSLLSGERTALIAPWRKGTRISLMDTPAATGEPVVSMEAGVLGTVAECNGQWCQFSASGFSGWISQELLWGIYPNEKIS